MTGLSPFFICYKMLQIYPFYTEGQGIKRIALFDDKARIVPPRKFTLEEALEYIQEDEYVEVTPQSIRLRKILLDETSRKRGRKIEQFA